MDGEGVPPRVGGVKVVVDVVDDHVDEIATVLGRSGFDVRRYYPADREVGPGGAARGYTRLGAERARRFTRGEQAAVVAAFEAVLDRHGLTAAIVGVDTWEAGGDDGGSAGVREPDRPGPRIRTGAASRAEPID